LLSAEHVQDVRAQGLEEPEIITALAVVAMFNYFTRVADATGIEFDYDTALPPFEPDTGRGFADGPASSGFRPVSVSSDPDAGAHRELPEGPLRTAWDAWRAYVLGSDEPAGFRDRRFVACVAAEECADWKTAGEFGAPQDHDEVLAEFTRKLSRQPWLMKPDDLEGLRAAGYSEVGLLRMISAVAHQNAASRLSRGLAVLTSGEYPA
jgi:hypothetical protein